MPISTVDERKDISTSDSPAPINATDPKDKEISDIDKIAGDRTNGAPDVTEDEVDKNDANVSSTKGRDADEQTILCTDKEIDGAAPGAALNTPIADAASNHTSELKDTGNVTKEVQLTLDGDYDSLSTLHKAAIEDEVNSRIIQSVPLQTGLPAGKPPESPVKTTQFVFSAGSIKVVFTVAGSIEAVDKAIDAIGSASIEAEGTTFAIVSLVVDGILRGDVVKTEKSTSPNPKKKTSGGIEVQPGTLKVAKMKRSSVSPKSSSVSPSKRGSLKSVGGISTKTATSDAVESNGAQADEADDGDNTKKGSTAGTTIRSPGTSLAKKTKPKGPKMRKKATLKPSEAEQFDKAEKFVVKLACNEEELGALWDFLDFNGDKNLSLKEVEKYLSENEGDLPKVIERHPVLQQKLPGVLRRAYNHAVGKRLAEISPDDDDPQVLTTDFPQLLMNWFFYTKLFIAFNIAEWTERKLTADDFYASAIGLGLKMTKAEGDQEFEKVSGGNASKQTSNTVSFDAFCRWYIMRAVPQRKLQDCIRKFVVLCNE